MKIAAVQMNSGPEVQANLRQAQAGLEEAASLGARLALLPENFPIMGRTETDKLQAAESPGRGPIQDFLASTARRLSLWIVAGTIPILAQEPASGGVAAKPRVRAASIVYDHEGRAVARYDKMHLFDVDIPGKTEAYRESATIAPGDAPTVIETPAGKLGLSVCYDVRFPELYRHLAGLGAQILAVPAAFTAPTGRAHWETLLRARAIENLCYVVAAAQTGLHANGRETYGDSMIIDHWGRVLARLPRGSGVVVADIDLQRQRDARKSFPALQHRRL